MAGQTVRQQKERLLDEEILDDFDQEGLVSGWSQMQGRAPEAKGEDETGQKGKLGVIRQHLAGVIGCMDLAEIANLLEGLAEMGPSTTCHQHS